MKKPNDSIKIRTRSAVTQPTALKRAPMNVSTCTKVK